MYISEYIYIYSGVIHGVVLFLCIIIIKNNGFKYEDKYAMKYFQHFRRQFKIVNYNVEGVHNIY